MQPITCHYVRYARLCPHTSTATSAARAAIGSLSPLWYWHLRQTLGSIWLATLALLYQPTVVLI